MNKLLAKIYPPLVILVDVALLIELVSSLREKYLKRKTDETVPNPNEEEAATVTEEA